jgi:acyl dehydratase
MATPSATAVDFDAIAVGDEVPPFEVALTLQRMVMEAGVNRDFSPIHHDREIAQQLGAPDMFINTLFLQGMYEAAVRNWGGLGLRFVKMGFRMSTFNCAGDVLSCAGRVQDKSVGENGDKLVTIEMWTESPQRGKTTSGRVVIKL